MAPSDEGHSGTMLAAMWIVNATMNSKQRIFQNLRRVYQAQRFDLRFFRPFLADLSIKKSSSFFPPLIAATSQRGLAPRPAQVSPDGLRYFGGTFFPFNALPPPRPRTTACGPAILSICSICLCSSARRLRRASSTRSRKSISASIVIPVSFAIVASCRIL